MFTIHIGLVLMPAFVFNIHLLIKNKPDHNQYGQAYFLSDILLSRFLVIQIFLSVGFIMRVAHILIFNSG
jgi:hypothetical protein